MNVEDMDIVYTPEGADPIRIPWKPGKIRNREGEVIEQLSKMDLPDWEEAIERGSMVAFHALLFIELSKTNPTLKYDQVDFCMDELKWELSTVGKVRLRDKLAAKEGELDDVARATLEELRADVGPEPPADSDSTDDAVAGEAGPKA